jgi:hypothetical protein
MLKKANQAFVDADIKLNQVVAKSANQSNVG